MIAISSVLLLVACGQDKGDGDTTNPDVVRSDGVTISGLIPTIVTVSWSEAEEGTGLVEYGLDGEWDLSTPDDGVLSTDHAITLRGLKAGHTYDLRTVTTLADGERVVNELDPITLEPPPASVTSFTISDYDPDRAAPGGYVLTALIEPEEGWVVIIDRDGDYVWYMRADDGLGVVSAHFLPEQDSIAWAQHDIRETSDLAGIVRIKYDGSEQWLTRTFQGHHDFALLPNGEYAWISIETDTVEIDGEEMTLTADRILEAPEGATSEDEATEIFSFFRDYHDLYVPCTHFYQEVYGTGGYDFSHGNSLVYDELTDTYRFMNKNLDNLMFINRTTGEVEHEMGGVYSDISTETATEMWSHGHYSQIWDDGFTIFDNGYHADPTLSRAKEYAYDLETGTLELVWTTRLDAGRFNSLLGDVKKLGDTYLVSWTEFGTLTENAQDGTVVWRAETELGTGLGRAAWVESLYDLKEVTDF